MPLYACVQYRNVKAPDTIKRLEWKPEDINERHVCFGQLFYASIAPLELEFRLVKIPEFLKPVPGSDYANWLELIKQKAGIETTEDGWWKIKGLQFNQVHLIGMLARMPFEAYSLKEDGPAIVAEKGLLPMKPLLEMGQGDPLRAALYGYEGKDGPLKHLGGHGLATMRMAMSNKKIPIERINFEKALQDLKNSKYGINDSWNVYDLRIGCV